MAEKLRIYIGGLGSNVQEDDLRKTFTSPNLGTVESVEIIRSKGRSFGYLDFVPVSDKGLAKLFSTYNGCMWKGGKLKLEKAREDYLSRLRRQWAEDAELAIQLSSQNSESDENAHAVQKPKKDQDIDKIQLRIFFPKLRKIKPVPLKGTGKHKYSFQRVEVPPLPVHFCDCEEHSGRPEPVKRICADSNKIETFGVNEEELNMMKSILDKLLEKDSSPKAVSVENEFTKEINHHAASVNNGQVDANEEDQSSDEDNLIINVVGKSSNKNDNVASDNSGEVDVNEEDQSSDEDNLVINVVGKSSNKFASFEDWGQERSARDQDSLLKEPESIQMLGNKKQKLIPDKKRKQSQRENDMADTVPSKRRVRKGSHGSIVDPVALKTRPTDTESGSMHSNCDMANSEKSAWKDLVGQKGSTSFHISDVLVDHKHEVEEQPSTDHLEALEKDSMDNQSVLDKELEKVSDAQPAKPSASEDKSGRGASWLQKSSWLQLVGDTTTSSFNITQILPGVTFENQELPKFDGNVFSNSKSEKPRRFVHKDQNSAVRDTTKSQETANEDIYDARGDSDLVALTKEQRESGKSKSDLKETVESKDDASVPMPRSNQFLYSRASLGDDVTSEGCSFVRNAASMKEWAKHKAALNKRKGGKDFKKD